MVYFKSITIYITPLFFLLMVSCSGKDRLRGVSSGDSNVSTQPTENGEGYSGENGEGYSGVINNLNGFIKCELERKEGKALLLRCNAWVKKEDGKEVRATAVQAGVSLTWSPPLISSTSMNKILGCNTSADTLSYQCNLESDDSVNLQLTAQLSLSEGENKTEKTAQVKVTEQTNTVNPGSGTLADPFNIVDVQDLMEIAADPTPVVYYKLVENIDLAGTPFVSIGSAATPFKGYFDGNGKTISNYNFTENGSKNVGLFGYIQGGSISNLTVNNVTIVSNGTDGNQSNYFSLGAMVGVNDSALITHCNSSGSISATGKFKYLGGLVGTNRGTVTKSHSSVNLSGLGQDNNIGGMVGRNNGSINKSYAVGNVSGSASYTSIGGLVGANYSNNPNISDSFSTGSVTGISSCENIGGLVGYLNTGATIFNSYTTSTISGSYTNGGGLLGYNQGGTITSSYYLAASSSGNAKTIAELQNSSTFIGWDFASIWNTASGQFPSLR